MNNIKSFLISVAVLFLGLAVFKAANPPKANPKAILVMAKEQESKPFARITAPDQSQTTHATPDVSDRQFGYIRENAKVENFEALNHCFESSNPCQIRQSEAHSKQMWVTERTVRGLEYLHDSYSRMNRQQRKDLLVQNMAISKWALTSPDDNIKSAALPLAAEVMPAYELIPTVIEALENSVSGPLYQEGLDILGPLKEQAPDQIDAFFVRTLNHGGYYAAEEIARQILPFLNSFNVAKFSEIQKLMPMGSTQSELLRANLQEYQLTLRSSGSQD